MSDLSTISAWFWPEIRSMNEHRRLVSTGDVISVLYSAPLVLAGFVWLTLITDAAIFRDAWGIVLLIFSLMVLFNQVNYFIIIEIKFDRYGSSSGSLASMIHWSALLLFGPTAIWLMVFWSIVYFIWNWRKAESKTTYWNLLRNLCFDLAIYTFAMLITLSVYEAWGGVFPLKGLTPYNVLLAMGALLFHLILVILIWAGYITYHVKFQEKFSGKVTTKPLLRFFFLSFGVQFLGLPFGILAAGLFVENGVLIYLFLILGLLLVAFLTRKFSLAVESSRQQSRQLEQLEQLGRAIIDAPPDGSRLSALLEDYVPKMFPSGKLAIWLTPDQLLIVHPEDESPTGEKLWDYILSLKNAQSFSAGEELLWTSNQASHNAVIVTPIIDNESSEAIGGIYIELRTLAQQWDEQSLSHLYPAIQTLAAQISSALRQSEVYLQTIEYQKTSQELRLAGKIQASFLPRKLPNLPGWQIAVTLLPARETSGDFFDLIPLSDGKLGILIADVMDKGVGPALYMALSRTLIRTYAVEYDAEPDVVFFATNQRLLKDARANLFVTAFYGILDPATGDFNYSNAGHNPPFLINPESDGDYQSLGRTGIAMGIEPDATWDQERIQINPGEALILYTDGIPDAQNMEGEFFDDERLIEIVTFKADNTAHQLQNSILEEMHNFVGDAPQFDDITLMVLLRNK